MKVCPNCGMANNSKARYCNQCEAYLGTVPIETEEVTVEQMVSRQDRQSRIKMILIGCCFILFFLIYNIWAVWMNLRVFGHLTYYFKLIPWYIPCLIVFFFPYDKVYGMIRKKQRKTEKHLSDFILMIFRSIAVLGLIQMYVSTYDILAFTIE